MRERARNGGAATAPWNRSRGSKKEKTDESYDTGNRLPDITEQMPARGPIDLPFLMLAMLLLAIGLIVMFSASSASSYYESGNAAYYFTRQGIMAVAGVIIMFGVSLLNYQSFRGLSKLILVIAFLLMLAVLVPGIGMKINGARRWINLGLFSFEPSEILKIAIILFFAARLSKMKEKARKIKYLIPFILILVVAAGLLYMQPHMSATILILCVAAAILFAAGMNLRWFIGAVLVAVTGLYFVIHNTSYMSSRVQLWRDPWSDPLNKGFQIIQSLYAIGSGGLLGLGFGQSRQKFLYLPEEHNDFVFSIACEELGYIGACIILVLFALLIIRGFWLALHARDRFGALVIIGITTQFAVQVFLNISVVTNLLPTTGISLPFFSYGGTALIIQLAEIGIVLSISRQIPAPRAD